MNTLRAVLITGATGGIGTALVDRFLAHGDVVMATDTDADELVQWRRRWEEDARLFVIAGDTTSDEDVTRIAEFARTWVGRVDILVNASSYFPFATVENMSSAQWREVIEVNLTGAFLMTQAVLPLMKDLGAGRIINFGSGSVFDGAPGEAHYGAAKAGIVGFSRSLARELGGYGITVNVIVPGLTITQTVRDTIPDIVLQSQRDARALHRDENPEDLTGPALFLASEDAAFITGQILNVDGGAYMY
ncbi:SDR family oxidoreductase [Arthrobacter sp. NamB2]|uniref:SDR family NAD(P)-dependent oxidoreductase n=1 Tax=Arthrobacter sp. NamB2 TaxID=2576035 RepID=UPI0010C95E89|nr:SDR family oxidoreductase [Arthrobacter sp. NamB2]TKV29151.1 SDR family oxidoreductase [Arthrobacter sp. NamB2]